MSSGKQELVSEAEAEDDELAFKPLTSEEAKAWRQTQRKVSVWRVVLLQICASAVFGASAMLVTGRLPIGWSAFYGGASVALPSAVMAWGMTSSRLGRVLSVFPSGSLGGLVFWEGVKVLLVVVALLFAPAVVSELSWLALLAGLVVVLKVYWLAFFVMSRSGNN